MKTAITAFLTSALLAACATGGGNSQIYGQISAGVEMSRSR
ncbi:hypothetical protein V6667_10055 [Neisseria leonii]|uniref:Lipoprotein n=1 Tax=Neisseria leonii TaxID=2995413 RepID=A0A9X4IEF3_9NEIS|nr:MULTISPECIES: hypothetical protein [unclassified Neisseria]MDD9326007.1 hypothetical protein [Neisseria sp. 3986]MDD9328152.1 hypothetical protein [Neisseria sp. 51.81]